MRILLAAALSGLLSGCYAFAPSDGAGDTGFTPPRRVDAGDVALPDGYRIEAIAKGLTYPTGVAFDDGGGIYVTESGYSYGEDFREARLLKIEAGGARQVLASGGKGGPWTGVTWHGGAFFVAQGGVAEGGAILRIEPDGRVRPIVNALPSLGDHHNNGPAVGPDGWIYFGQGTATNSGIVGADNRDMGWLERRPDFHDIACRDLTFTAAGLHAYAPFAQTNGGKVAGRIPCSGAVLRVRPEGGPVELVAWGLRNPFGLAFSPQGRLYVTDNMYDERGERPVFGAGDLLWQISAGGWYGWPDFHGDAPLDSERYAPPGKDRPKRLLAASPGSPPKPNAVFEVHASADGFDFAPQGFGHEGQAFVALFGDQAPATGKVLAPVGAKVVRVNVETGVIEDFAVNKGKTHGPASWQGSGGLERPIAARFDPAGGALYVVDFGVLLVDGKKFTPQPQTGVLWRITRQTP